MFTLALEEREWAVSVSVVLVWQAAAAYIYT
jgi:hypothetical protein